jgi:demethylmenaquinone methyltransferase/2-methoxy-6-polyprenyl-1,4-benzoquinol methylase
MDNKKIIEFFDIASKTWDDEMIRDDGIINEILDNAEISTESTVLDVACGTGVLIPDYLKRSVKSVFGIDISPKMIQIARSKFKSEKRVNFTCGDVCSFEFNTKFHNVIVYNAFPHFQNPEQVVKILAELLEDGGVLSIAHGMSKKQIDSIHKHAASDVSISLLEAEELAEIVGQYLSVTVKISDDRMYQVCGKKK